MLLPLTAKALLQTHSVQAKAMVKTNKAKLNAELLDFGTTSSLAPTS